jgi:putative endonuclease
MQHKEGMLEVSLRPMAASAGSTLRVMKTFAKAIAREKQLKGWRREKKLNLIRTINPEFKDLAQTWGWMTTAHEKTYP